MLGFIRGHQGCIGAGRECRYSGARSGIGSIRGHWGLLGVKGLLWGVRGCRVYWGGKWTGRLTTLGRVTTLPLGVTYLAKAKQVTEMSSAGYYIHLELYFVTICTFYLCHLNTYSCTQCKEMLYALFSLQTNLCLTLHHQSHVL